jgi:hypothetical protein
LTARVEYRGSVAPAMAAVDVRNCRREQGYGLETTGDEELAGYETAIVILLSQRYSRTDYLPHRAGEYKDR